MTTTNEQTAAFAQVQIKVAELQDALIVLNRLHPNTNVGLVEWCDDLNATLHDLSEDLYQ